MAGWSATTILVAVSIITGSFISDSQCAHIKLSLFYETLCKESARFVTTQVYKTLLNFGGVGNKFFQAEFFPYGKARTAFINGTFEFICQHGERECIGNKIQACALAKLPPVDAAAFINCSMSKFNPPVGDQECLNSNPDFNYTRIIESCSTSWEGDVLHAYYGIRTKELRPNMYFLPWPVFNGEFTMGELSSAQNDLQTLVCNKLEKMGVDAPQCKIT